MRIFRSTALPLTATALLMAITSVPAFADSVNPTIIQSSEAPTITNSSPSNAKITGNAGSGAVGETAINVSAGIANQQLNIVDSQQSTISNAQGPLSATFTLQQTPGTSGGFIRDLGGASATIDGSTVLNMIGEAGVNVAGGIGNMQGNSLVFSRRGTTTAQDIPAGIPAQQYVPSGPNQAGPTTQLYVQGPSYSTTIAGDTARNGAGNVGLNATSGVMNMQGNNMFVSDADDTHNASSPTALTQFVFQQQGTSPTGAPYNTSDYQDGPTTSSHIGGNVGRNETENFAANASAGVANMQINDSYLLSNVSGGNATVTQNLLQGNVDGLGFQGTTARRSSADEYNGTYTSTIDGSVLRDATGVASLNSAAGAQNAQANLTTLVAGSGSLGSPSFTQNTTQTFDSAVRSDQPGQAGPEQQNNTLTSRVGGNAGMNYSGILAINNATGEFNQQGNATLLVTNAGDLSGQNSGTVRPSQTVGQYIDSNPVAAANISRSSNNSNTNVYQNNDTMTSSIGGYAASGSNGIAAMNVTSGAVNQQTNEVMLFTGDTPFGMDSNVTQQIGYVGNPSVVQTGTTSSKAQIDGHAFDGSKGIAAANVSAGALNQQANAVMLATSSLTDLAPATNQQLYTLTVNGDPNSTPASGPNSSVIGGSAFAGATGQIGANVAAGIANQQSNQLTVVK